jgi:hypothetical protein
LPARGAPGTDGPALPPLIPSRQDLIPRPTPSSVFRLGASWLAGAYVILALEGLHGRILPAGGGCVALSLLGLIAAGEWWAEERPPLVRGAAELAGLAVAGAVLCWPLGWPEPWEWKFGAVVLARAASWLLAALTRLSAATSRPGWRDRLPVVLLGAVAAGSLGVYLTPDLVGPIDARWYANVITDFLTQVRAGTFPVFSGATAFAFNGAVHPFRSAPWQFDLAAAVDLATGRQLAPVAVQHATVILSYGAATLGLYVGLVRLRPAARATAFAVALVYATSPGITASLVMHDMYMTMIGGPVLVAVLLLVVRAIERPSARAYAWLGASCALLWLCHPPLALLGLLLAAFCVLGHLAVEGPSAPTVTAGLVGAAVFALLAAPYFVMTRGLATGPIFHPFADLVAPAVGLWLLALGLAQAWRRGSLRWLALAFLGIAGLQVFQPSLVPFAALALVLVALVGGLARGGFRARLQARPEPWLLGLGLVAAGMAESWFPRHGVVNFFVTADLVRGSSVDPVRYFRPLFDPASDQPGLAVWALLLAAAALAWRARSAAAALGTAAAVLLVVGLGFIPRLSLFLWINVPPEIISVIGVAYNLRLLPVLVPVVAVAAFLLLADERRTGRPARWAAGAAAVLLLGWSLWEHGLMFRRAADYRLSRAATAEQLNPDNIILQRYTWDLLTMPLFFSNGYMDPRLESRFFAPGPPRDARNGRWQRPLIGPEETARAMEFPGQAPLDLVPTVDPRGAQWLYLAPRIILAPGERKLLRFDFMGRKLAGWLIVRGDHFNHEYILPHSGTWWGFGSEAPNSPVIPVANSGPDPLALELVYLRDDTAAPLPAGPLLRVWASPYDPRRAPIALEGLDPLRLRVDAPVDGTLETFRSFYPGYEASVDGRAVTPSGSYDGLVDVPVGRGRHEVVVRFTGTTGFRLAAQWQMVAGAIAALAAAVEAACALRRRRL